MHVQIFQSLEDFYRDLPVQARREAVTGGVATLTFDLPPGNYLVRVMHDANADGRINANAFGTPTESSVFYTENAAAGPVRPREAFFDWDADVRELEVFLPRPPADPRAWGAGVMILLSSNPYRGGDTVVRPLPLLTFVGESFFVVGPRAGYNLIKNPWLNANLTAEFKFAGDAFKDEKFLAGMDNRRDTLMAGFDAGLRALGRWRVEMAAQTDVLGRHDGQEVSLGISRAIRGNRWSVTPGAGLVWRSSNYNRYYFGVRDHEATDERPAYDPGASVEWFGRLFSRLELSESWSLLGSLRFEWLSDDVRDSPIVDKNAVTSAFIGLNYAF